MGTDREKGTGSNFAAFAKLRACPLFALPLLLSGALQAAAVKGIVLDDLTGRPLARTRVSLTLVGHESIVVHNTTSTATGQFEFEKLPTGWCIVSAARFGYAIKSHGQKLWNSPGLPVYADENTSPFLTFRMHRLGGITGTVLDENEIGLPEVEVLAYRAASPPALVGKTRSDDRGVYRIGLLEPGRYFIRTGPKQVSDGFSIVPTFHREGRRLEEAINVDVRLDETTGEVNVKPEAGRLINLEGVCAHPTANPVPVWLVSEIGRLETVTDSAGRFSFNGVTPGLYELYAGSQAIDESASASYRLRGAFRSGAYTKLMLARGREDVQVTLRDIAFLYVRARTAGGGEVKPDTLKLCIRRKDLAGTQPAQCFSTWALRLPPGRWEARVETPPDMYPLSVTAEAVRGLALSPEATGDGWTELTVAESAMSFLDVRVSQSPATIRGKVTASGGEPALGAPVYLDRWDEGKGKRIGELRQMITDAQGTFRFRGLAPGSYRIVSSFDFGAPDEELMGNVHPKVIRVSESDTTEANLSLYVIP